MFQEKGPAKASAVVDATLISVEALPGNCAAPSISPLAAVMPAPMIPLLALDVESLALRIAPLRKWYTATKLEFHVEDGCAWLVEIKEFP